MMTFGSAKLSENKQYTGEGTEDHTFEDVSFCYLTSGRNWNGGDESCHVLQGFYFLLLSNIPKTNIIP